MSKIGEKIEKINLESQISHCDLEMGHVPTREIFLLLKACF